MFSKLNNIKVYDVFNPSSFDEDFGLTEEEVRSLVPEEKFGKVKDWYNNVHVGNSWMFYIYSVLSSLDSGRIDNYWGQSGTIDLLGKYLTSDRAFQIGEAVKELGVTFPAKVDPRVSLQGFFNDNYDQYYYSVAIQAGYLTYEREQDAASSTYLVRAPNRELINVWREYILLHIVRDQQSVLKSVFMRINNPEEFSDRMTEFLSYQLSYYDLRADRDDWTLEKTYHLLIFGLMLPLGYKCSSNREAGYGRYDLLIEAPAWTAVIEFKAAESEKGLSQAARKAVKQIKSKRYLAEAAKGKPRYAIGVGCYKKRCVVKTAVV
jgi:hypothetical protein